MLLLCLTKRFFFLLFGQLLFIVWDFLSFLFLYNSTVLHFSLYHFLFHSLFLLPYYFTPIIYLLLLILFSIFCICYSFLSIHSFIYTHFSPHQIRLTYFSKFYSFLFFFFWQSLLTVFHAKRYHSTCTYEKESYSNAPGGKTDSEEWKMFFTDINPRCTLTRRDFL